MIIDQALQQALTRFSGVWTRHEIGEKDMQQLRSLGLIERRQSRNYLRHSHLFRLTPKGIAAKAAAQNSPTQPA